MRTTPFGMKGCVEYNTEHMAAVHGKTPVIELMYDIFPNHDRSLTRTVSERLCRED